MPPPRLEDSMSIRELLLPEFDQEMANTRKLLEIVPEDRPDFKPHAKSMPLGRLAAHVAELPSWVGPTIDLEVLDLPPGQTPYVAKSRRELLEKFDRNVAEARQKIAGSNDEHLAKIWTLKFAGKTIASMPRSTVLRTMVMNHLVHHRAQLGVYLRLNEIPIPGMYGASADEAKFWEAEPGAKTA
jgi:uncharacterized damage-inducible protein DinB